MESFLFDSLVRRVVVTFLAIGQSLLQNETMSQIRDPLQYIFLKFQLCWAFEARQTCITWSVLDI